MLVSVCAARAQERRGLTRYVDPFVGTGGHGHTFPGATLPFGMVQLSPDTRLEGWDGCSGYHYSDSIVYGFSHTHLSGTGISDYGDVLLMPTVGEPRLRALDDAGRPEGGYASRFTHAGESAAPGYYSVRLLDEDIRVELTATLRAGLHRYTFPRTDAANVVLDLTHRDKVLDSRLRVTGPRTVEGFRRSEAWARDQLVYFAVEFSQPFTSYGLAVDELLSDKTPREAEGKNVKAFFRFDARAGAAVLVRVGISAVSAEGARRNLRAEIGTWDFERVRRGADAAWERELNRMQARGGSEAQLKNFYTALYHSMLAPNLYSDVDGRYRGRDFRVHRAEGFDYYTVFSLWDTFRAAHPLYTLLDRRRTRDFALTFLAQYEQGGRLPVWELSANETDTMIGYHAVSVLADAAAKGVKGFDVRKALEAAKHSARLEHFGLASYAARGYVSAEDEAESVSKTLEYAYDDWCVARLAELAGRREEAREFDARARSYRNLFDPETGFMRARRNGDWLEPFDPREVNFNYTEANAWQYAFFAPHDVSTLIDLFGGSGPFARRLDELFTADSRMTGRVQPDITGLMGQYAHGNEPSHHVAYLYAFAGQPWKTQARVRRIMDEFYKPAPDGLAGNEDCGQMSAWYVLSAAGLYPVTPGSTTYVVGTPLFPELRINLDDGRAFTVRAEGVSDRNFYVQSAALDGRPHSKSYLTHEQLTRGGRLVFRMGPRPNVSWGAREGERPVARTDGEQAPPVPVVRAGGETFRGRAEVRLQAAEPGLKIFYTTDGSEPDARSTLYGGPFTVERETTVKAVAVNGGGRRGRVVEARLRPVAHDWSVRIGSRYDPQYAAGGDLALVDGRRGGPNFRTGAWQGYRQDFEAVIDLGRPTRVRQLGAGFLQDVRSWIWMPTRVEFELSRDGKDFEKVLEISSDVPERDETPSTKEFSRAVAPREARYVRVRAYNYGRIPAWHPGAGDRAWLFIDEITVE